jgi:U3 small nucleolar RNA-associated protein 12
MVKSYLRYDLKNQFGVINSRQCNVVYDATGMLAISAALDDVLVWNVRQGVQVHCFPGENGEVSSLAVSPDRVHVAAGCHNGAVCLYDIVKRTMVVTLQGHKRAVKALRYNASGSLLVSGSRDTNIIVWDVLSEAGLYRLKGHQDEVTEVCFLHSDSVLVSSSKDGLLKVWDLATQHCIQTCVGTRTEIWTFDVDPTEQRLVTGSADNLIRVWKIAPDTRKLKEGEEDKAGAKAGQISDKATEAEKEHELLSLYGSFARQGSSRAVRLRYNHNGSVMAFQGVGQTLELYKVCTDKEIKKKVARRKKRGREKKRRKGDEEEGEEGADGKEEEEAEEEAQATDELELLTVLRTNNKNKISSFDVGKTASSSTGGDATVPLLLGMHNNTLEMHALVIGAERKASSTSTKKGSALELPGHPTDVRSICLSSDDQLVLSVSGTRLKLWNAETGQCIRTMTIPEEDGSVALCAAFLPGDRHVVAGTKEGGLYLFELASGECIDDHPDAHEGPLWSLAIRPDAQGMATGSADHLAKFWRFQMGQKEDAELNDSDEEGAEEAMALKTEKGVQLLLVHTRTLKMVDDILCVRYSHTKSREKLLFACALTDNTVKVFYEDSLSFFLSLYGHKLPVMSFAISDDDTLMVTASADKNVKLWGLDFGDCHKSLFAHDDSVMGVAFVPGTHYFWTCGKDRLIKYWDGDTYEEIMSHDEHRGEVRSVTKQCTRHVFRCDRGERVTSVAVWRGGGVKIYHTLLLEVTSER